MSGPDAKSYSEYFNLSDDEKSLIDLIKSLPAPARFDEIKNRSVWLVIKLSLHDTIFATICLHDALLDYWNYCAEHCQNRNGHLVQKPSHRHPFDFLCGVLFYWESINARSGATIASSFSDEIPFLELSSRFEYLPAIAALQEKGAVSISVLTI